MHTIIETARFISSTKNLLTEDELEVLKETIANAPESGDLIKGTGGFRKIRLARKGSGKSGGYRLITFFYNENIPVFLIDVYAKNQKEDLTKVQENALKKVADQLANYGG